MDETIRPIRQRMDFVRRHIGKNSGAIAPHIIKPKNMPYNGLEFNFGCTIRRNFKRKNTD